MKECCKKRLYITVSGLLMVFIVWLIYANFIYKPPVGEKFGYVEPDKINELSVNSDYVFIDIRKNSDFNNSHINNAINIEYPSQNFIDKMNEMDRTKRYVLYDDNEDKNIINAKQTMKDMGFKNTFILFGGYSKIKK